LIQPQTKGQVATEFMLYTAVFMLLVIASFVVVNHIQNTEIPLRQNTVAKETGSGFSNAITLAVKGGRGFYYNYSFPRTIFTIPYKMDLSLMNDDDAGILLEWPGSYGNFTYLFNVPVYSYEIEAMSGCLDNDQIESDECSNTLLFYNDGENLTIRQLVN